MFVANLGAPRVEAQEKPFLLYFLFFRLIFSGLSGPETQ